jgi:hypothetical protein
MIELAQHSAYRGSLHRIGAMSLVVIYAILFGYIPVGLKRVFDLLYSHCFCLLFRLLSDGVRKLSLFLSLPVCRRSSLLTGEGEGVGEEQNETTAIKPGPL